MSQYFIGVLREFKYIRWLSLRRAIALTGIVIIVGFAMGFILGAVDNGFTTILKGIVL